MKDTLPDRVRLGTFEVDLRAGEVRDGERIVYLQEQALFVLCMLVQRDGEILLRDEIKKKLWPNDTVVDFDHGVNAVIRKLRQVFCDSADEPRYIGTIARRGYRLLVPIQRVVTATHASVVPESEASPALEARSEGEGTAVRLQRQATLIGQRVSHYRVLAAIGGGGMGMVYKAEDLKLGRQVALKFLPPELASDPIALQRFEREARAASSLDHPNICTVYEVEEHEGQPFIVMQLLQGETLRDHLAALVADQKTLPLDELLDVAIQICDGLQAEHAKGIIHRDIKPANIFLTGSGQVKILDFGLAKLVGTTEEKQADGAQLEGTGIDPVPQPANTAPAPDATLTRFGVAMGTAGYMSPEQVRGEELDARTDIFSFGLILYEMATGRRAFAGETAAVHNAILNDAPAPTQELNAALPPHLVGIINKMLEKDRDRRFQSVSEIRAAVELLATQNAAKTEQGLKHIWKWLAGVACSLAIVAAAGGLWRFFHRDKLNPGDTLVVADFVDKTGDPTFKDALQVALATELGQTPFLDVLGSDKVRGVLKEMNRPENEPFTAELAREVCLRTNSAAVVAGSISDEGNSYRIALGALSCRTGETLATSEAEAKTRSAVVKTLGSVGEELRRKLGEPAASLQRFTMPLDGATSSSIEALQAFHQADKARMANGGTNGSLDAIPLYTRALDLDPKFALASAYLGGMYSNVYNEKSANRYLARAMELRNSAAQRDRFFIEASYYHFALGNLEKAIPIYKEWLKNYPRDYMPLIAFGNLYDAIGELEASVALMQEAIRLNPDELLSYQDLMEKYSRLNRPDEALAVYNSVLARKVDPATLALYRYNIAVLQNDTATMMKQATLGISDPDLTWARAQTEQYHGHFRAARELWMQASELYDRLQMPTSNALETHGIEEAMVGNVQQALKLAHEALIQKNGDGAAMALALAGDSDGAERVAQALNREGAENTITQRHTLPCIRAVIAMNRNRPAEAIKELAKVPPYDKAEWFYLLPVYLRGEAYLKLGNSANAAAEFQRVLDNPGLTQQSQTGVLSHLQLGRAQVMMGDKAAARNSYQRFLTLWKDADPDIPIYKQAKAEYAKLQ